MPALGGLQGQAALPKPVTLTVTLAPQQPTFSMVTVTQQQSLTDLLTSIVGLLGVLSAFGVLFQMTERALKARGAWGACDGCCPCLARRRGSLAGAAPDAFAEAAALKGAPPVVDPGSQGQGGYTHVVNPLAPHAAVVQAEPGPAGGGGGGGGRQVVAFQ